MFEYYVSTCCAEADQHGQSQPKGVPGQTFSNTNLHARDALQTFFKNNDMHSLGNTVKTSSNIDMHARDALQTF